MRILFFSISLLLLITALQLSRRWDKAVIEWQIPVLLWSGAGIYCILGFLAPVLSPPVLIAACCITAFWGGLTCFAPLYPRLFPIAKADGTEALIIVLGAPVIDGKATPNLVSRINTAYSWMCRHPLTFAILSGGNGHGCPEAPEMANMLRSLGLPEVRFCQEGSSTTTQENFRECAAIFHSRGFSSDAPVVIVTNDFHIYRLRKYASDSGFTAVRFLIAPTPAETRLIWYFREAVVILRFWILGS